MTGEPGDAFWVDEEPLRKVIVKGYFGDRTAPLEPEPLMARLRDLLSGPPGGETDPGGYWFEKDPDRVLPAFLAGLDAERPGLAALIADPILAAARGDEAGGRREIPPSPGVFVTGLAGPIALKAKVSEATAAALLAGLLIAVARLGPARVASLYRK